MRKKITTINEAARAAMGITRDEYALCDYVQFRQADRRGKAGWCVDHKKDIAEFVGITRAGLYKMIDRLSVAKIIFADPATGHLQVTEKWIDTTNERKLSLHDGVNKVDTKCKLSLHGGVNLVTPNIEVKEDNKKDKLDSYLERERGKMSSTLKTETHTPPPPNSAQPPAPAAIEAPYSAGTWIQNLTQNPLLREAFTIGRKIPSSKFDEYLRRFQTVAAATAEQYNREADVKRHFLNWAAIQHQQETKPAPGAPEAKGRPKNIPHYG